jgi:hypothetical protein
LRSIKFQAPKLKVSGVPPEADRESGKENKKSAT